MTAEDALALFDILVTAGLGLVAFYFAHNYRRQVKLGVVERRLAAYENLWSKTAIASPTRLKAWGGLGDLPFGPLTETERTEIFASFVKWYYENGYGMMLEGSTRNLFLAVKDSLVSPIEEVRPKLARKTLAELMDESELQLDNRQREIEVFRGRLSIKQLSLLRTRMKADLEVFGVHYFGDLDDYQRELLQECGESLWKKPWRNPWRRQACEVIE